jgi:hypothetical protein
MIAGLCFPFSSPPLSTPTPSTPFRPTYQQQQRYLDYLSCLQKVTQWNMITCIIIARTLLSAAFTVYAYMVIHAYTPTWQYIKFYNIMLILII